MRRNLFVFVLPLLLLAACTEAQENELERDAAEMEAAAEQQLGAARAEFESTLSAIDRDIEGLEARAAEADQEVQQEINQSVAELREQRDAFQQNMQRLENAGADAYQDVEAELAQEQEELEAAVRRARLRASQNLAEFQGLFQNELNAVDRELDELERQSEGVAENARAEYNETVTNLRQERQELGQEYEQIENASEAEFMEARNALADDLANFGRDVRQASYRMERELEVAGGVEN